MVKDEIERLEKTVHTLARLPWLIRREYWVSMATDLPMSQYERPLAVPAHGA